MGGGGVVTWWRGCEGVGGFEGMGEGVVRGWGGG